MAIITKSIGRGLVPVIILSILAAIIAGIVFPLGNSVQADTPVTVSLSSPGDKGPDSDFIVTVNNSQVADLNALNYDILFDSTVFRLDSITSGRIGTTSIPANASNKLPSGAYRVLQYLPGATGVSGSGLLAELHFHVIALANTTSQINISNGLLGNTRAEEIIATWTGCSINVVISSPTPTPTPATTPGTTPTQNPNPAPVFGGGNTNPTGTPNSVIDNQGVYLNNFETRSEDNKLKLSVNKGTLSLNKEGKPAGAITIEAREPLNPIPQNAAVVALAYNLGPEGTVFDPPIQLRFSYDPAKLPAGANEKDLSVVWWNSAIDGWTTIPGSIVDVETHTITASITHFTLYAVLANVTPPTSATPSNTKLPAATLTPSPSVQNTAILSSGTAAASIPAVTTSVRPASSNELQPRPDLTATTIASPTTPPAKPAETINRVMLGCLIAGGAIVLVLIVIILIRRRTSR